MASMTPVNDPAILAQLNATAVTDPAILAKLNGESGPDYSPIGIAKSAVSSLAGLSKGIKDPIDAGAQMLVHAMPDSVQESAHNLMGDFAPTAQQFDEQLAKGEGDYQKFRQGMGNEGIDGPRMVGNVASTVPISMALPAAAPQSILGNALAGAGYGAGYGALQPVTTPGDFASQKMEQMGTGAATGGVASAGGNILGRMLSPNISSEVKTLMDAGVNPTPGQIMGGGWKATEDKLTSVPVLGDLIKNSQQRSIRDFNTATYNQALAPLGKTIEAPAGREGVEAVKTTLSDAYNNLLPKLTFKADPQFTTEISNLTGLASNMPKAQSRQFTNLIQNNLLSRLSKTGMMDGQSFKGVESELSQLAKGYASDSSFDNRQLGAALQEALKTARSALERANPQYAPELQKINQAYGNYAIVRNAASKVGTDHGVFTPAQLQNAVRAADTSAGKGNFATGNARMQDMSEAGKSVLGNTYPDSGTAGRSLTAVLGGMLMQGGATYAGHPFVPLTAATAALPYTSVGQKTMAALLAKRPEIAKQAGEAIQKGSPFIGSAIAPFTLGGGF